MKPEEFKQARRKLGLSQAKMARALKLESGCRAIAGYESGERGISGPIQVAIRYMLTFGLFDD